MKSGRILICAFAACLPASAHDTPAGTAAGGGHSTKLAHIVPNLYGPAGIVLPNPDHAAHFSSSFQTSFGPLMSSIVNQLTALPLPSPASGFLFTYDPSLNVYTRSGQSFGPIFAERAETIGKGKFFSGISYQHINFDRVDDVELKKIPAVFVHQPAANPDYQKDIITTSNSLDVQLGQTIAYFTYGMTDRMDISVAIPMVNASMEAVSDATIQRIGTSDDPNVHFFDSPFGDRNRQIFSGSGRASGIGDVLIRVKSHVWRGKSAGLALGVDGRMPTGDEYNFLGSGAYGVRPFLAFSARKGSFSPHINAAYQWNGNSVLSGNVSTGEKGNQSDQFQYAIGFDYGYSPKLTFAVDYLSQVQLQGTRVRRTNYTGANGQLFPNILTESARFQQNALSAGFKVNPVSQLLVSFNLLFALNHSGLRDTVIPLIGASYTF